MNTPFRIVLTGGGTAGHITPNIALLPRLRALGADLHYIGTMAGMESELISREGVPYYGIQAGKLRRYLDVKNLTDVGRIGAGFLQALGLLRRLRPDVVFSKGGFVSCPVVWAARLLRIPAVIHESDLTPGLANRLAMPFATRVCVAFPETLAHIAGGKGILTGLPVRDTILAGDAAAGRGLCGFAADRPVILVIGGSLGSQAINTAVRAALPALVRNFQVCHICGPDNLDAALDGTPDYRQFGYVHEELPHLFALADLAVSRAGATTLFEFLALRKPHLLIPLSLRASRGDQILNARSFANRGFSSVLPEEELTDATLLDCVQALYREREEYVRAMGADGAGNGVEAVVQVIAGCAKRGTREGAASA